MKLRGILIGLSLVSLLATVAGVQANARETSRATATWNEVTTWKTTITTTQTAMPPPVDVIAPLGQIAVSVVGEILAMVLGTLLLGFVLKKWQDWKDGSPSKTPSTIKSRARAPR
jgi:hypothetical protein